MTRKRAHRSIPIALGLLLSTVLSSFVPAAHAATIISGNLYYTTFQAQGGPAGPNVYKTAFVYDSTPALTFSADCLVASLMGADGLILDPNDSTYKTLIVGEQKANLVASIAVGPNLGSNSCPAIGVTERKADGTVATGQAYALATPNKNTLWMIPNDPGPNPNHINVASLPLTADGVPHTVTGADGIGGIANPVLTGVAFMGTQGYYGDANDGVADGHFGTISSGFVTARVAVVDDTVSGTTDLNGSLPTHGMTYDRYSGCIIASGANQIWQLCPGGVGGAASDGKFHVRAKIVTGFYCVPPGTTDPLNDNCGGSNWDQATTDSAGHMFAANNNGDVLFVDYSSNASRLINGNMGGANPVYQTERYLRAALDEVIDPLGGDIGCVLTPGGYKNRFNYKVIPISFLSHTYSAGQVTTIVSTGGGGVNALGRSLFAALLNIHYGAVAPSSVTSILAAAEADYIAGKGDDIFNTVLEGFNTGSAGQKECTQ
jgi:hypothetical protein